MLMNDDNFGRARSYVNTRDPPSYRCRILEEHDPAGRSSAIYTPPISFVGELRSGSLPT
jgi:hypothetical protein